MCVSLTSHHHVHTAFATAVSRDVVDCSGCRFWPASCRHLVDRRFKIFCSLESRSATRHEQKARVAGLEQKRHKGGCHDLGTNGIDIP